MELIIKLKEITKDSRCPKKQKEDDAGIDAYIRCFKQITYNYEMEKTLFMLNKDIYVLKPLERIACPLGFTTEIPKDYYAQIVPRSGLALWKGITILNTPGTIDAGYRNEWMAIIVNLSNKEVTLKKGDRICQIIIQKKIKYKIKKVRELGSSKRGLNGFGSTEKKEKF